MIKLYRNVQRERGLIDEERERKMEALILGGFLETKHHWHPLSVLMI